MHRFDELVSREDLLTYGHAHWCSGCEEYLQVSCFSKNSRHRFGLGVTCKECTRAYQKRVRPKYRLKKNTHSREARTALRLEVLTQYSSKEKPVCACCDEPALEFLALDHTNGGGNKHKKEVRHVYKWVKKNGYPDGFRVLCHNCNQALGAYGYCPHQRKANIESIA